MQTATGLSSGEVDPLGGTAYRVIRRVGAGAMGEVFEAEHKALGRRVAVKVLSPGLVGAPGFVDRLRLEAQALASVRHPNVVVVHDHAVTPGGVPFLVMELLRGRTLQEVLRERLALPLLEALCLVDQVFAGLMAIHAAGLAHRDLKPANIFLAEQGGRTTVKLLDFGLVKVTQPEVACSVAPLRFPTEQGHVLGTPRFMAPEQVTGGGCDARSDLYAAGVLLFLLLSGRDPFHHHRTPVAIWTAHVRETPPLLSTVASQAIPPGVDAAVARALAKAPEDRFASIADFGAALVAAIGGVRGRGAVGSQASTEKMPAGAWGQAPPATVPLKTEAFRASRGVLPFVLARAPSFGLPPPVTPPRGAAEQAIASPKRATGGLARWGAVAVRGNRPLYVVVGLLWLLLAAVAWKVL